MSNRVHRPGLNHVDHKLMLNDGLDDDSLESIKVMLCDDDFSLEGTVSEEPDQFLASADDANCVRFSPIYYPPINMSDVNRDHNVCHHCGENLTNRRFYNHLFDHHGYTKQQLEAMKANRRIEMCRKRASNKKKLEIFFCDCGLEFASKLGWMNHKQRVHGERKEAVLANDNIVCPSFGCELSFCTYIDLAIHVDANHRKLKWKRDMEKQTRSEFFLRATQKVSFANKTALYKCLFSNSRGRPKGRRCEQCPAFIRTCERKSGKIEVVGCFGHLGHDHISETNEARHLRQLKWEEIEKTRQKEAMNLQCGESSEQGLGEISCEIEGVSKADGPLIVIEETEEVMEPLVASCRQSNKRLRMYMSVASEEIIHSSLDEDLG